MFMGQRGKFVHEEEPGLDKTTEWWSVWTVIKNIFLGFMRRKNLKRAKAYEKERQDQVSQQMTEGETTSFWLVGLNRDKLGQRSTDRDKTRTNRDTTYIRTKQG